jgi:hypothetical protein
MKWKHYFQQIFSKKYTYNQNTNAFKQLFNFRLTFNFLIFCYNIINFYTKLYFLYFFIFFYIFQLTEINNWYGYFLFLFLGFLCESIIKIVIFCYKVFDWCWTKIKNIF